MNTKIIKALLNTSANMIDEQAIAIVEAHNNAATYGFIDLPLLDFCATCILRTSVSVTVQPKIDSININNLYILQQTWGADELNVHSVGTIELIFHNK